MTSRRAAEESPASERRQGSPVRLPVRRQCGGQGAGPAADPPYEDTRVLREKRVALIDLLDRILDKGVIIRGDITISVADVDLVYLGLKLLLSSVETAEQMRACGLGRAAAPALPLVGRVPADHEAGAAGSDLGGQE